MTRRQFIAAAVVAMLVGLAGCTAQSPVVPAAGNGLIDASAVTGCLTMYVYEGTKGYSQDVCDVASAMTILNRVNAVPVTKASDWSPDRLTFPIYGFHMENTGGGGTDVEAAWTNGYWIGQTGDVFNYQLDFAALAKDRVWGDKVTYYSTATDFPCALWLVDDATSWTQQLMVPADDMTPPKGVTMALDTWDDDIVTVSFTNNSGTDWAWQSFALQRRLGDTWYSMPRQPDANPISMPDFPIAAGQKQSQAFNVGWKDQLPPGTYRLVVDGMAVEHVLG